MVKVITFDIFNTIIKTKTSPIIFYQHIAKKNGIVIPLEILGPMYKSSWQDMKSNYPAYGFHQGMTNKEWWSTFMTKIFVSCNQSICKNKLENISSELYEEYKKTDNWIVFPSSFEILQKLTRKDIALGIISNCDDRFPALLSDLNLFKYFSFTVFSCDVGFDKPNFAIYEEASKLSGANFNEILHVGDDLEQDYMAAKNFGMKALLLDRERRYINCEKLSKEKNYIINDMIDIFIHL